MNSDVYIRVSYKNWLYQLQHDGLLLKYIPHQDIQLCTVAVKTNPRALKYVQVQNDEMCLLAVSNCGDTLKYVKFICLYLVFTAVKKQFAVLC